MCNPIPRSKCYKYKKLREGRPIKTWNELVIATYHGVIENEDLNGINGEVEV